jgi:hypothetical protein
MKVQFVDIFDLNADGTITPKKNVNVGCVMLIPGIHYPPKNLFLGFNLLSHKEEDIEVEEIPGQSVVYLRDAID